MKPRVLFVSARLPYPCTEGHQLRTFGVISQLAKRHEIHLLSLLRAGEVIEPGNALNELCCTVEGVPVPTGLLDSALAGLRGLLGREPLVVAKYSGPKLHQCFQRLLASLRPQLVHFDLLPLAALARRLPPEVPWILNEHNVESDLIEQRLPTLESWARRRIYQRELALLRQFERHAAGNAHAVLACSEADASRLRDFGARKVHVVPNGVDTQSLIPSAAPPDPERLVFLGGMTWYPNRLGLQWFVQEVMPGLLKERPAVQLDVIGNPEPAIDIPASVAAHVHRHGFVDDFVPLVRRATAMIVPLQVGSGTRLKVVEGLALGKCLISTRKGAEGICLRDQQEVIFADTADEFRHAIVDVFESPEKRKHIEQAGRKLAEQEYDWNIIGSKLFEIAREAIGQQSHGGEA